MLDTNLIILDVSHFRQPPTVAIRWPGDQVGDAQLRRRKLQRADYGVAITKRTSMNRAA